MPIDKVFADLRDARSRADAAAAERAIEQDWAARVAPTTGVLVTAAHDAQADGKPAAAIEDLSSAIDLQPELGTLWRLRAEARFASGDRRGAVSDLGQAIDREPRDFLAWQTLSDVTQESGDYTGSLAAWQRLLLIDPHAPQAARRLDLLRRKALGNRA